jgi:hypothetical protein
LHPDHPASQHSRQLHTIEAAHSTIIYSQAKIIAKMSGNHKTSISQLKTVADMSANAQPSNITNPSSTNPNNLKFTRAPGMNSKRIKDIVRDYFEGDRLRRGIAKLKFEDFDWEALTATLQVSWAHAITLLAQKMFEILEGGSQDEDNSILGVVAIGLDQGLPTLSEGPLAFGLRRHSRQAPRWRTVCDVH